MDMLKHIIILVVVVKIESVAQKRNGTNPNIVGLLDLAPERETLTATTVNNSLTTVAVTMPFVQATQPSNSTGGAVPWRIFTNNYDKLKRAMYVMLVAGGIVLLYFGVKTYRSRQRASTRSYGLLATRGDTIELNPLNSDSDDDYTVFEAKPLHR